VSTELAEPPEGVNRGPVPLPKIQIPARAAALVTRPRLLDDVAPAAGRHAAHADGSGGAQVTLLCGPAGGGKTTLLVDWARHRRRDAGGVVAWVSLGPDDNDVFVLWSAILRALERTGAFPPSSSLYRLPAPRHQLDQQFTASFVAAFRNLGRRCLHLVLDDLHEVTDPQALATLETLLRNAPPQLHLVLATRYAPPLGLPRLRLEGRVRDIDRSRLSFTEAEADALLRLHGVEVSTAELGVLLGRTEGWAAGLRLAAMSLAQTSEHTRLIADFAGDNRAVADYLLGEVLERQDPGVLDFLLATSTCEQLSADLARLLSGREDAGALLDGLERTNSFVTGIGDGWYRYHPMLRQYLSAELSRRHHHRSVELHRRAAHWFRSRGDTLGAVEHAAQADDDTLLAALLVGHGLRHVTMGEAARLRRVLRRTPAIRRHPTVAAVAALAAMDAGDTGAARDLLNSWPQGGAPGLPQPHRRLDPNGRHGRVLDTARDLLALERARDASDVDTAAVLLARSVPAVEPDLEMLAHVHRGDTRLWLGRLGPAARDLSRAQALAVSEHRPWLALTATAAAAATALHAGDFDAAAVAARDALWLAEKNGWDHTVPAIRARTVLGWVAYQRMDDQTALAMAGVVGGAVGRGLPSLAQLGPRLLMSFARHSGAAHPRTVVQDIRDTWRLRRPGHVQPQLVAVAAVVEQSLALAVGEAQWAAEVVERVRPMLGDTTEIAVLRAVQHVYRGRAQAARHALLPVLRGNLPAISPLTEVEAWLWEARLALRLDDGRRAGSALAEAVTRAAPIRLLRPFQRGGDEVHELIVRTAGTHGHHEPFVAQVRALVAQPTADAGLLTTRELELLAELPSLLTADEIAESMYLSVNTVKTHIRGIYRKLGVNTRRDAVESARRRGLL
jgi:LuxR family maltose regulon positive regulatory protein